MNWNRIKADQLRRMRDAFGELIEYRFDGKAIQLRAIVGKTVAEVHQDSGVVNANHVRDFLCGVCDLVDETGQRIEPARGHRICRLELPDLPVFQVGLEGSDDCYRYSDAGESQYRIHTKAIGSD